MIDIVVACACACSDQRMVNQSISIAFNLTEVNTLEFDKSTSSLGTTIVLGICVAFEVVSSTEKTAS